MEVTTNEGASAERHPTLASTKRLDYLFVGSACHVQRHVPVAELFRSAASESRFDALRLGVFAPLRFDGIGFNAETPRRGDAHRSRPFTRL